MSFLGASAPPGISEPPQYPARFTPIEFANREWTEFVFLSLFRNYAAKPSDVAWSIDESDSDAGIVTFDTQGDRLVKVTVELQYTPQSGNDPDAEVRQVQDRLRRDLEPAFRS